MKDKALKIRLWMLAGAFVAIAVGFRAMLFSHLPGVFSAPEEDLSFGWYVPLFSLYVLWTEREKLRRSFGSPSAWALPWLLPVLMWSMTSSSPTNSVVFSLESLVILHSVSCRQDGSCHMSRLSMWGITPIRISRLANSLV